jgi:small-conductance mechanosensitive channel
VGPLHQIATALAAQLGAPATRAAVPSCPDAPQLCDYVFAQTGSVRIAEGSYLLLVKPLRIVLIIALAILARLLINRTITRLVQRSTSDKSPLLLRPLRQKMPTALRDAAGMAPERHRQRAEALGSVLRSIASATIFVIAVMQVLSELGLDLAPMLASAGIAGLAIGFGAQNLVKDFIAGMFMLLEDQYGVGDNVDVGQASGTVEAVGLRITTIRDGQGIVWYIRNGEIVRIGNKSQGWSTATVDIPVSYSENLEAVIPLIREVVHTVDRSPQWRDVLLEEPQVVGVESITGGVVTIRIVVKTAPEQQYGISREIRERVKASFDAHGIKAPTFAPFGPVSP